MVKEVCGVIWDSWPLSTGVTPPTSSRLGPFFRGAAVSLFSPRYTHDLDDRDVTFLEAQMFLGAEVFLVELQETAEGGQVWGPRQGSWTEGVPQVLQNQRVHSGTREGELAGRVPLHSKGL